MLIELLGIQKHLCEIVGAIKYGKIVYPGG
jgi:hypothetical protein